MGSIDQVVSDIQQKYVMRKRGSDTNLRRAKHLSGVSDPVYQICTQSTQPFSRNSMGRVIGRRCTCHLPNRGYSFLSYEVSGELAFWSFFGHWPDLRGHRLTQDLKLGCQRHRLVTSNTLVLNRSSSSLRSQSRGGSHPPPPCALKDGEMFSAGEG